MASSKDTPAKRREFLRQQLATIHPLNYGYGQRPKPTAAVLRARKIVEAFGEKADAAEQAARRRFIDARAKLSERIAFEDPDTVRADVAAFVQKYAVAVDD